MEEQTKIKLTVFTPIYNRAHIVHRLYESLLRQSNFSFEWLIIDDGSTDNIKEVVSRFSTENFKIRYFYKVNGGKHTAYNTALQLANGEYFVCVDSDDILTDHAVQDLTDCLHNLPSECGIVAYKSDFNGKMLGTEFPSLPIETSVYDLAEKIGCRGEYTYIYPTEIVKLAPFPVFEGESFVTESVVYDRIDKLCRIKLLPKNITVCEYQTDGYSASVDKLMKNNPTGYSLYFLQRIDLAVRLFQRLVYAGKYHAFRLFSATKLPYKGPHKLFTEFCRPVGRLFWLYYKLFRDF